MKTANEIQLEALAMAYDSLRLYTEDMTQDEYESDTKREWVGLTNNEIQKIVDRIKVDDLLLETSTWHIRFARAVQRKLKEKNT
jgi:hypothetical protein